MLVILCLVMRLLFKWGSLSWFTLVLLKDTTCIRSSEELYNSWQGLKIATWQIWLHNSFGSPPQVNKLHKISASIKAARKVFSQCNELNRGHPTFFSQSQDWLRTKESEFIHFFGPNKSEVKSDWELMQKAMWKVIATLLVTAKCCSFSSPKRQINIFWMGPQKFCETDYLQAKCGPRMLKTNSTQIRLLNGSLEEFNKYIYRKAVDRELWGQNGQECPGWHS